MFLAPSDSRFGRGTVAALAWLFIGSALASARPWTNTEGVTIEAGLISANNQVVVLGLADGRRATYPLEKLCQTDQDFAKNEVLRLSAAAKVEEPPKASRNKERTMPEKRDQITTPELAKIPHPADNSEPQLRKYIRLLLAYDPYSRDNRNGDQIGLRERAALLLSLGEANLDLLIEQAFSGNDEFSRESWAAVGAISKLATDDSREMILKAYAKNYQLAPVITAKKWGSAVEAATLHHLKKMPDWNGYSSTETEFTALCLSAERPEIWTEFQRFAQRGPYFTVGGILSNLERRHAVSAEKRLALYQQRWNAIRKNPDDRDLPIANVMVEQGDLDALKLIGRLLVMPAGERYLDYQLKRSTTLVVVLTDAPAGTNAEIGQWIRKNAPSLSWDSTQARFVAK